MVHNEHDDYSSLVPTAQVIAVTERNSAEPQLPTGNTRRRSSERNGVGATQVPCGADCVLPPILRPLVLRLFGRPHDKMRLEHSCPAGPHVAIVSPIKNDMLSLRISATLTSSGAPSNGLRERPAPWRRFAGPACLPVCERRDEVTPGIELSLFTPRW